ncbi:aminoglycoside phosphotransferase [Aureimonas endophytica]|uniref:Aminoglycoside phosphotransferase n=1 Tax=Aureimonas endophytica TaxID=2027858 RepID=A0A916ZNU1_9HYPH|nr:phosphotransferase [Aureimonas endophytica]GGE04728.1 aminoglycoside phosphotransferase [Aureimonas endophytica]
MLYDQGFIERLAETVRARLSEWGASPDATLDLLTVSENATFLLKEPDRRLILRVHRPDYHTEAEIASELAWIEALRAADVVPTPRPVPTRDGKLLVAFENGDTRRHVVAFEHRGGREPEAGDDLPRWFRHLGAINARLHRHARGWTRPAGFTRKRWNFATILGAKAYWGDWRDALGLDASGRAVLERLHRRLEADTAAFGEAEDRFGLVHCDLRAANLLVEGEEMAVIDFDDCGFSWFGYDFAAAVSFIEHEPIVPALMEAWLEGYRGVALFAEAQAAMLPAFVMLRRMQLTAWIASHAETPTAKALGPAYTQGTVTLAERYLAGGAAERAA